eukprot:COSAG05_NODE_4901_length_1332_cov_2.076237_2_plen_96_part_00
MMCFAQGTPACNTYASGYGPQIAVDPPMLPPMVDPGFGVDPVFSSDGVAAGGRCAAGFCEDMNNCPQCASGLTCTTQPGMMCAGTCFGTCQSGGH